MLRFREAGIGDHVVKQLKDGFDPTTLDEIIPIFESSDLTKALNQKLADDFLKDIDNFGREIVGRPELVRGWEILYRNGRTGGKNNTTALTTNIDALASLTRVRSNPKTLQVFPGKNANEIDDILGNIWGAPNISYSQMIDDLEIAIEALPLDKTSDFWKVIADGQRGLVNKNNVWDRRHSWLTLKKIKENETFLKNADEVKFEVEIEQIDGISNAVPDIVVTISAPDGTIKRIIGEVKAGDKVITTNFNSQCLRYFQELADIRNLRLFRRHDILLTKQQVIDSWKGGVTTNERVRELFTDYYNTIDDAGLDITFTQAQLEHFLSTNDSWFDLIFNSLF